MNAYEFASQSHAAHIQDPPVKVEQRWRCLQQQDMGRGPEECYINIMALNPFTKKWVCSIPTRGGYINTELDEEFITKNFEHVAVVAQQMVYGTGIANVSGIAYTNPIVWGT